VTSWESTDGADTLVRVTHYSASAASREPAPRSPFLTGLLRMVMPLTDLPVAIVTFTVTVTGVALAAGLLPLFLVGVPLFVVVGALARWMAAFERKRMRLFLDIEIPSQAVRSKGLKAVLRDGPTWRAIAYHVVQFPLAVLTFALCFGGFGTALALVSMPGWVSHVPAKRADLGILMVSDQGTAWAVCGVGVLVALFTFGVTYGLTTAEGALARAMLGITAGELAQRVDVLQGSRARVVDAAEAERRRIERNLHDGAQQRLVALAMNLGRARARYDDDPEAARRMLDEAHGDAKLALTELRDLARGLHPAVLTDRGLDAALSGLAARSTVPVTLDVQVEPRCSPTIEAIAYFVVSEALTNAAKHAKATSVRVTARRAADSLRVVVEDDGVGGADPRGSGLTGLADRVGGVDGSIHVQSPTGGPTVITVELPCAS
jgi:signal transduction histidine kinase